MKPKILCLMAAVFILPIFFVYAEEDSSEKKLKIAVEIMPLPESDPVVYREVPCADGIPEPNEECEIDSDCALGEICNDQCVCTVKEDPLRCLEGTSEDSSSCSGAGCARPVTVTHPRTGEQKTCYECANFTIPEQACPAGKSLSEGEGECCEDVQVKAVCPSGFTSAGTPPTETLKCCECTTVDTSHCWNGSVQSTQCGADGVIDLQFEARPFSCAAKHQSGGTCIPLCTDQKRDCGGAT